MKEEYFLMLKDISDSLKGTVDNQKNLITVLYSNPNKYNFKPTNLDDPQSIREMAIADYVSYQDSKIDSLFSSQWYLTTILSQFAAISQIILNELAFEGKKTSIFSFMPKTDKKRITELTEQIEMLKKEIEQMKPAVDKLKEGIEQKKKWLSDNQ